MNKEGKIKFQRTPEMESALGASSLGRRWGKGGEGVSSQPNLVKGSCCAIDKEIFLRASRG